MTPTKKNNMSEEIEIEKNIPIPNTSGRGKPKKYPFEKMDVGDSFLHKCDPIASAGNKLRNAARNWANSHELDHKFTARKAEGGFRIWRTK